MKKISLFLAVNLLLLFANAQEWCGSIQNVKRKIQNDPQLQAQWENYLRSFQQSENNLQRSANATQVYIPVVFHIVHNGDAIGTGENITDAQAQSQIDAMNLHYNAQDPKLGNVPSVFQNLIANIDVKFCLAKYDPIGLPTTGIVRHQMAYTSWDSSDLIDNVLKPATIWDNTRYLNIWSVRMGGELLSNGVLAYSSFPFFSPADEDGVVARFNTIGTTGSVLPGYNLGKTITHEVGHWFGLQHVWGDDNGACNGSDGINDTPNQADANYGCPTFPSVTCNNGPNGDMFMNYMDYTNDDCHSMFTPGQSARMHFVLDGFRNDIKNSATQCFDNLDGALVAIKFPKDTVCSLSFVPVVTIKNNGLTTITSAKIYYQIAGGAVQIFQWNGSLQLGEQADVLLPAQSVFAGSNTLDVSLGNINGQPSDADATNNDKSIAFNVYDGGNSSALPFSENFENSFPQTNWSIVNADNDVTWIQNTNFGAFGASAKCVSIDNFSYVVNPSKKKDAFITDSYNFTSTTFPEMTFDITYAQYNSSRSDSLNIYYSFDCGSNWTKIWSKKGADVATVPDQTTKYTPFPEDWQTKSIPLLNLAGQNKVSFKFENVTGWGNVMYIDNINVQNNPAIGIEEAEKVEVKIFPNPANNIVAVRLPLHHPFKSLQLFNSLGEMISEANIFDSAIILDTEKFNPGIYILHLSGNGVSQNEKLLIVK